MRVAVTGASGNIGGEAARQLRAAGHEVLSLDIRPPADLSLSHRVLDLRDPAAIRDAFTGMDVICHIGEIPSLHGQVPGVLLTHNVAVGSSVIQAVVDLKIPKLVYTSTAQVYGCWGGDIGPMVSPVKLPMDETAPLRPQNAYSLSKVCNERFAEIMARQSGTRIAAFRFPWVMRPRDLQRLVEKRIASPSRHWQMNTDGFSTYIGLEDTGSAYLRAVEHDWDGYEAFHFVAEDVMADEPVLAGIARLFPDAPLPDRWPEHAAPVSTEKARRMLGWCPKICLTDAIGQARERLAAAS